MRSLLTAGQRPGKRDRRREPFPGALLGVPREETRGCFVHEYGTSSGKRPYSREYGILSPPKDGRWVMAAVCEVPAR